MKRIFYIVSAVCIAMLTACSDDEIIKDRPIYPVDENEVPFGAGEGVLNTEKERQTRTIYEVGLDASGKPENFDKYTNLRVSWLKGDSIRVFSPEAPTGYQTADYTVTPELGNNDGYFAGDGFLVKVGANGIHWGEVGKTQNFYAFYPGGNKYIKQSLKNEAKVNAYIPVAQEKGKIITYNSKNNVLDPNGDWKIISPNMEYCMMTAETTAIPDLQQNLIKLQFNPFVTVFDLVVNGPKEELVEYKVLSVSLRSKSQDIVGPFSYDFKNKKFEFPQTGTDNKIATIDCMTNEKPISLKSGDKLNLKFFLLPRNINSNELIVSVLLEGGRTLSKSLGGNTDFAAGKIIKVRTPKIKVSDTNNWMSLIDDQVYFASQLSLPGAKHAYSYKAINPDGLASETPKIPNFGNVNTKMMNFFQTKNIKDLFNSGVRAFDIKVTTVNDYAEIYAAGRNTGIRLSTFLQELSGYLNPNTSVATKATEAAVVTINYVADKHSSADWLNIVLGRTGVQELSDARNKLKKVTANTTMGEMRGKIGIIVYYPDKSNISTTYTGVVDYYSTSVQDYQGTHIYNPLSLGGSGKLFIQNLYQVNNPDIYTQDIDGVRPNVGLCPHYILKANDKDPLLSIDLIDRKKELISQLLEHSQQSNLKTNELFMNDCAGFCVVNNNESTGWGNATGKVYERGWFGSGSWNSKTFNVRDPQYVEKHKTKPTNPQLGDIYFERNVTVDGGNPERGQGGNTALFAEHINPAVQEMIHQVVTLGRAPLGLVFMNFAGVSTVEVNGRVYKVEGVNLPSIIMTNNFKFDLMQKPQ